MIGIFVFALLGLWGLFSVWLGRLLSRTVFARFTTNAITGEVAKISSLITLLLIAFVFFLPIADEIISYPSYYSMCEDAGKYRFASGMDEQKVTGREYRIEIEREKLFRLFPTWQDFSAEGNKGYGVVVNTKKLKLIDDNTNELLFTTNTVKPLRSAFAIFWDGGRIPWLLRECSDVVGRNGGNSQKYIRSLNMHLKYHMD